MRDFPYVLERRGVVMEPDPNDPREAWGVLNPACARGRDGELYLFPRIVAEGNYSRIARARVRGRNVERLGIALEPEQPWEQNRETGGGVEDPRITFVGALDVYVMAYTAYGPSEPKIALATSTDLDRWERVGLVAFAREAGVADLDAHTNKDAALFPELVAAPDGEPRLAILHRPTWPVDPRAGIWISFARDLDRLAAGFAQHRRVAFPEQPWEALKVGAGPPPIRVPEGWLLVYHGVSEDVVYSAGAMILDADDVTRVVARTAVPLLEPELREEREGTVANVVFPTAIDQLGDGTADLYYGMADARIGVARLSRRQ